VHGADGHFSFLRADRLAGVGAVRLEGLASSGILHWSVLLLEEDSWSVFLCFCLCFMLLASPFVETEGLECADARLQTYAFVDDKVQHVGLPHVGRRQPVQHGARARVDQPQRMLGVWAEGDAQANLAERRSCFVQLVVDVCVLLHADG
jgi:hypothetical protein